MGIPSSYKRVCAVFLETRTTLSVPPVGIWGSAMHTCIEDGAGSPGLSAVVHLLAHSVLGRRCYDVARYIFRRRKGANLPSEWMPSSRGLEA